jgi:hypothetical protein
MPTSPERHVFAAGHIGPLLPEPDPVHDDQAEIDPEEAARLAEEEFWDNRPCGEFLYRNHQGRIAPGRQF